MSNKSPKKARSSAQILAEIAALPPSVQGTISSYKNVRKNGTAAVYYNLQYTHKGKNHSFAIPVDKVEDFKAAITAGRKLKDLVLELSLANARELASAETPLKKKLAQLVLRGAAKIHAVVDAAAGSIERDGIACTSKLEQTLFDDMNGLCRELMAELLSAGAATASNYEPEADERNAGNHGKRIVTLFGELPEIKRTYYWNEDGHSGHYPFDDRLGLVGRYTPAAADEMARCAVSHPYKDAMREYKYYRSNAGRMKYDEYRANGWFIGSGVIESGCKTVVGQRFKQSGMIWSLKGAKALLPLRTLYKSNRLEQFFAYLVRDLRQVDCAA